ncbi:dephospho-CoA kinase [Candidatus Uabimicrobium sp. HlEnr_7]|uniref:dephospho-CoA kinase n=1 Tax=Candidatus Uabimicrobium helgolandensis TaxID=3095367 RepID=UPI0035560CF5
MEVLDTFHFENRENLHILGVMGGVASGKTTVTSEFTKYGAHIINADLIVHQILQEKNIQQRINQTFPHIFPDAKFDKKLLAEHVFAVKSNLKKLEQILHPQVRLRIKNMLESFATKGKQVVIIDAPLLWENGLHEGVDTLIFIDTPIQLRRERAQKNRGWSVEELDRREKFQSDLVTKKQNSDYVIINEHQKIMEQQVKNIWDQILSKTTLQNEK